MPRADQYYLVPICQNEPKHKLSRKISFPHDGSDIEEANQKVCLEQPVPPAWEGVQEGGNQLLAALPKPETSKEEAWALGTLPQELGQASQESPAI